MSREIEIWKSVIDYEGFYEVSNFGRVRSLDRIVRTKGPKLAKGQILSLMKDKDGYTKLSLCKNGVVKQRRVHQLVFEAFNPDVIIIEINHKDFHKANNYISNLENITHLQNQIHAKEGGRYINAGRKKR